MKTLLTIAACSCLVALSACGGSGDDALGDNVAEAAETRADTLEAAADNAASDAQADALETRADQVERTGEALEEAIDEADVNATAVSGEQAEPVVNGM